MYVILASCYSVGFLHKVIHNTWLPIIFCAKQSFTHHLVAYECHVLLEPSTAWRGVLLLWHCLEKSCVSCDEACVFSGGMWRWWWWCLCVCVCVCVCVLHFPYSEYQIPLLLRYGVRMLISIWAVHKIPVSGDCTDWTGCGACWFFLFSDGLKCTCVVSLEGILNHNTV